MLLWGLLSITGGLHDKNYIYSLQGSNKHFFNVLFLRGMRLTMLYFKYYKLSTNALNSIRSRPSGAP